MDKQQLINKRNNLKKIISEMERSLIVWKSDLRETEIAIEKYVAPQKPGTSLVPVVQRMSLIDVRQMVRNINVLH